MGDFARHFRGRGQGLRTRLLGSEHQVRERAGFFRAPSRRSKRALPDASEPAENALPLRRAHRRANFACHLAPRRCVPRGKGAPAMPDERSPPLPLPGRVPAAAGFARNSPGSANPGERTQSQGVGHTGHRGRPANRDSARQTDRRGRQLRRLLAVIQPVGASRHLDAMALTQPPVMLCAIASEASGTRETKDCACKQHQSTWSALSPPY